MSAALLKRSLEIVDPDLVKQSDIRNKKRIKKVLDLIPESQKVTSQPHKKGRKGEKVNLLRESRKLSIVDVRNNIKSGEAVLKDNLRKLDLIKKACMIRLDKRATHKIIQRGVTKRALKPKREVNKNKKTAFTEEDFETFEREFMNE